MNTKLYVRTILTVPGAGTAIHVAELTEIDTQTCLLHRLVALAPDESIVGAATPEQSYGEVDLPQTQVPHPDTYHRFPDIEAKQVSESDFHQLWEDAQKKFSERA